MSLETITEQEKEHFPTMKYKKPIDKKKELEKFYKEVAKLRRAGWTVRREFA